MVSYRRAEIAAALAQAGITAEIRANPWWQLKGPDLSPAELAALRAQDEVCAPEALVRRYHHVVALAE